MNIDVERQRNKKILAKSMINGPKQEEEEENDRRNTHTHRLSSYILSARAEKKRLSTKLAIIAQPAVQ